MIPERLKAMLLRLPIVRLLRTHAEERAAAEERLAFLAQEQHDVAKRVHVIEWLTYPHTDGKGHLGGEPR